MTQILGSCAVTPISVNESFKWDATNIMNVAGQSPICIQMAHGLRCDSSTGSSQMVDSKVCLPSTSKSISEHSFLTSDDEVRLTTPRSTDSDETEPTLVRLLMGTAEQCLRPKVRPPASTCSNNEHAGQEYRLPFTSFQTEVVLISDESASDGESSVSEALGRCRYAVIGDHILDHVYTHDQVNYFHFQHDLLSEDEHDEILQLVLIASLAEGKCDSCDINWDTPY